MNKLIKALSSLMMAAVCASVLSYSSASASEVEVRRMLVAKSIAEYEGACPCPFTKAADGSKCGKRSAYLKDSADKPMCFPKDVPTAMVAAHLISDVEIKRILVAQSIAAYEGKCPCPYTKTSNGSECGQRSAYAKRGGDEPMCFPGDVPADSVLAYRISLY
ncbi:hypothetical protein [Kordiimonas sp.]|uniref:hypothetical protein n=1 Tax=Kordiimonas sp. TaxID=1970157 RepID=UPI003A923344